MPTLSRRHLLAGISAAAAGAAVPPIAKAAAQKRLFTIADALRRSDVGEIVASPSNQWAFEIGRPMLDGGLFGERHLARARGQIWLADARLERLQLIAKAPAWDWAPLFSPDGSRLAFLRSADGHAACLAVRGADGTIMHFTDAPPCAVTSAIAGPAEARSVAAAARSFVWLDARTILYVADRETPYIPEFHVSTEPVARNAAWTRMRQGQEDVRVWNDRSPTCGAGNALVRLDVRTGVVTTLLPGDVRGASVSPDGQQVAALVATEHLPLKGLRIDLPDHFAAGDGLVRLELQLVDLRRGAARRLDMYQSAGSVTARELPIWNAGSSGFAVVCRDGYDDHVATHRVLEIGPGGGIVHAAISQLDAEAIANLIAIAGSSERGQIRLQRRPQLRGINVRARSLDHLRPYGEAGLYVFDGNAAHLLTAEADIVLEHEQVPPAAPVQLRDGRLCAYGWKNGAAVRWLLDATRVTFEPVDLAGSAAAPAACSATGHGVFVENADEGTFFWSADEGRVRKASFAFNRHFSEVQGGTPLEVPYRNVRGEDRLGVLVLPPTHRAGDRHPVVMWAYPDHTPSLRGSLCRLNGPTSVGYPFQSLLAAGFAVFWAALPVQPFHSSDATGTLRERVEPQQLILGELPAAVAAVDAHPAVASGRIGFFGHSNAGYVALMAAAHMHDFKAIVAYSTFPDWIGAARRAAARHIALACGGFMQQNDRFYAEGTRTPYALGVTPWEDPEKFIRASSIFSLHKATTPVLFLQGEFDTMPTAIEQAYSVLQANGVPSELAYYRNEAHNFVNPANVADLHARSLAWFQKYLR